MSYVAIEEQIKAIPEEYLDEVSTYIDFVLFKADKKRDAAEKNASSFFGCIPHPMDGMEIQRSLRNEWN